MTNTIQNNLENMRQKIRETLKNGTVTNVGTFTHWDESGAAHFITANGRKGWTGRNALHLIQVR
jgi:hypothetical protein